MVINKDNTTFKCIVAYVLVIILSKEITLFRIYKVWYVRQFYKRVWFVVLFGVYPLRIDFAYEYKGLVWKIMGSEEGVKIQAVTFFFENNLVSKLNAIKTEPWSTQFKFT